MAKKQDYKYLGILYPDATDYCCKDVLENLESVFTEFAYIQHDKCVDPETGAVKKPHYHWVGRRLTEEGQPSPCPIQTVVAGLGLKDEQANMIEFAKSWKKSVRYLIHIDDPTKAQYDVTSVVSNFELKKYFGDLMAGVKAAKIYDFIYDTRCTSVKVLTKWVIANGVWDEYRRGFAIFASLLHENSQTGDHE